MGTTPVDGMFGGIDLSNLVGSGSETAATPASATPGFIGANWPTSTSSTAQPGTTSLVGTVFGATPASQWGGGFQPSPLMQMVSPSASTPMPWGARPPPMPTSMGGGRTLAPGVLPTPGQSLPTPAATTPGSGISQFVWPDMTSG